MVRLKDIALRAGVSVMTVSKALRDAPDVSEATKGKIKLLAQQLGYVPDSSAQNLRTRTTRLIGLALPSLASPFSGRIAMAVEERARAMGFDLLIGQTMEDPEREEACIRKFLSRRVEGILIAPVYRHGTEAPAYREILARKVPTIVLGHPAPFCNQFPCVEVDDLLASYSITQHLLKLGHKHIAFLAGPLVMPATQERLEGYRRALRENGLELNDKLVFQTGLTIEDGSNAALQMINEGCQATAVQAINDLVAIGCAQAINQQGIMIPENVSVVGFGDVLAAEVCRTPLTTINEPKLRLGIAAMDLMQKLLRGKPVETKRISAELIVRASSGIAPATFPISHIKNVTIEGRI
jgi:LacI family transcriptional regulator